MSRRFFLNFVRNTKDDRCVFNVVNLDLENRLFLLGSSFAAGCPKIAFLTIKNDQTRRETTGRWHSLKLVRCNKRAMRACLSKALRPACLHQRVAVPCLGNTSRAYVLNAQRVPP